MPEERAGNADTMPQICVRIYTYIAQHPFPSPVHYYPQHHINMVLGNLITCRYPLLEQITYEYEDRLTSTGPLMIETTALAQGFTMGRGYFQYLYPGGPDNIISNELLALKEVKEHPQ